MDLPVLLTFILHGNVLAESVLPQEWTRPHGQRAGLRPSWLVYGYRGWPMASVAPLYDQRVTPSGRADVGMLCTDYKLSLNMSLSEPQYSLCYND